MARGNRDRLPAGSTSPPGLGTYGESSSMGDSRRRVHLHRAQELATALGQMADAGVGRRRAPPDTRALSNSLRRWRRIQIS